MKRIGNLWHHVVDRGNLALAFTRAARGKRHQLEVRHFEADLDARLALLRDSLLDGTFELGRFHSFKVYDPKERTIHAARFAERVFHHALMNVCEPYFEQHLVFHSYACRVGKGRLKALEAAQHNARQASWYLKLDIRKYFESIPHGLLLEGLRRMFKDPDLLDWLERIVRSHRSGSGRGLPIGSLTSQHFANHYLSRLDRFCQALPEIKGYVRYMDDFVVWSSQKKPLLEAGRQIAAFVSDTLELSLKQPPTPQRTALGMDFLGCRIFPDHTRLARRSKVRFRRKLAILDHLAENHTLGESHLQARLSALTAFTLPVCSHGFRQRILASFRSVAIGHEPGKPGRQLEQQRKELPLCQPQQEHPGQPQQQPGLPPRPQLRPNGPDGVIRPPHQGTEPATVPIPEKRDKPHPASDRAGRAADAVSKARSRGMLSPSKPKSK